MRLARRLILFLAPAAVLGCAEIGPGASQPGTALTALPRALTVSEQNVLSASNDFTFALWGALNAAQPDSNIFVSPLSASFSLGMTMNGAAGSTYDEMRTGLRLPAESLASIDSGYSHLIALLTSLDPGVTLQIANSIWYRNSYPFLQSFLTTDAAFFNATVKPLNFDDVPGSLSTINGWVNSATNGRIPSILDKIERDDVMFLINAIYFKAGWRTKFDPSLTQSAAFHGMHGDQQASLMHREAKLAYTETSAYQAVDLPYGGSAFTMTVILPKPGNDLASVAGALTAASWQTLGSSFHSAQVDLFLPKVTMSWDHKLIPDLETLGMHTPFVPYAADFTNMSTLGKQLYISQVRQKAWVDIDEEGTEAAAVTVTGVTTTAAIVPVTMRVDHPFLFAIRERLSGTVLFMGKVVQIPG